MTIMINYLCVLLLLISINLHAEVWYQIGYKDTELECPDVIEITKQHYVISNECYGQEVDEYRIETGALTLSNRLITFSNREVLSRSFLQGLSNTLSLDIKQGASGEVQILQGQNQFNFIIIN